MAVTAHQPQIALAPQNRGNAVSHERLSRVKGNPKLALSFHIQSIGGIGLRL